MKAAEDSSLPSSTSEVSRVNADKSGSDLGSSNTQRARSVSQPPRVKDLCGAGGRLALQAVAGEVEVHDLLRASS